MSSFGKDIYGLGDMEVGEMRTFTCTDSRHKERIKRAAYNRNTRTDRFFVTRSLGNILYVQRVR